MTLSNKILMEQFLNQTKKQEGKIVPKFSKNTKIAYEASLKRFMKFCDKPLLEATERVMLRYRDYLIETPMRNGELRSNRSINGEINICLSSFYTWAVVSKLIKPRQHPITKKTKVVDGYLEVHHIRPLKLESKTPPKDYILVKSLPKLFLVCDLVCVPLLFLDKNKDPKKYIGTDKRFFRDHLIFLLLYRYGMRISEPLGLLWNDVDLDKRTFLIRNRKRGYDTLFPMTDDVYDAFCFYWSILRRFKVPLHNIPDKVFNIRDTGTVRKLLYKYQEHWESFYEFNNKRKDNGELPIAIHKPHRIFRASWATHIGEQLPTSLAKYLFGQRISTFSESTDKMMDIYINIEHTLSLDGWGRKAFLNISPPPSDKQFYVEQVSE